MNSPERHFTRYMDHDWGDGSFGRHDRVLYTCDEEGPDGPLYDEHFRPITAPAEAGPLAPPTGPVTLSYRRGEGLQSSWAIIAKGGVVFAEEPISHDLCDAAVTERGRTHELLEAILRQQDRLESWEDHLPDWTIKAIKEILDG